MCRGSKVMRKSLEEEMIDRSRYSRHRKSDPLCKRRVPLEGDTSAPLSRGFLFDNELAAVILVKGRPARAKGALSKQVAGQKDRQDDEAYSWGAPSEGAQSWIAARPSPLS